ncbi:histidine kinase dimerization/phospho-acceptor domain-containing protein [Aestuariivirga sp.]|uniref:histidine kinase dimerization/phospho-acceptor domain-containing protein n=1 Tax=Aestuariivirga sp. TaxID=2650926 RepID=UPI0039E4F425
MNRGTPTLGSVLVTRVFFFAILAMLLQLAVVFLNYYWNVGELSRLYVEQETERLAEGIQVRDSIVTYHLPAYLADRYEGPQTGYVARIRKASGSLIFNSCDDACEGRFLPIEVHPPDFWLRTVTPGKPLALVGGRAFSISGQVFVIDVETAGDPQDVVRSVLLNEVLEHMIIPMGILLVLVLGATTLSVRQALKPVHRAAAAAEVLDPLDARSHLQSEGMPQEIAHLTNAVNKAFARVGELMQAQRTLTSGISHEVRTPLAAIKLELERISSPRARKAERDLDELVQFVDQMTALARLESFDHGMFETVNLAGLCQETVSQLAPWIYENNHAIELAVMSQKTMASAIPALLKDALRNLIENAVFHTPRGTGISVVVLESCIRVESERPLSGQSQGMRTRNEGLGIGLKIVRKIAGIHGGSVREIRSDKSIAFELYLPPGQKD